jgi:hypothetical protein
MVSTFIVWPSLKSHLEPNMQKSTIYDLILYTLTQFTNDIM